MNEKRKILVIGAGLFQMPAIVTAKEMGLKVVATDMDPGAAGLRVADYAEIIDVKDIVGTIEAAKKHGINGVISVVSELGVRTAAEVAEAIALPGLRSEAAAAATNKAVMRQVFTRHDLPSPAFLCARLRDEAGAAVESLGLPVVVKPTDSSGSRGVSKVETIEELDFAFNWAMENSLSKEVIVEGFVDGDEMTVEAVTYQGEHEVLAMSGKTKIPFPYCVSIDLTYPPPYPESVLDEVRLLAKKALTALGIDSGASHTEILWTAKGPVLVEVAARGGGFGVFSDIIPLVSGVDAIRQCINIAMGFDVDIKPKYRKAAVLRFFTPSPGTVRRIAGLAEAKSLPGAHRIELDVKVGDHVGQIRRDGERPGLMIVGGETREEAVARADLVEKTVRFDMETVPHEV